MESSALKKHSSRGGSKTNTLKKELPLLTHPLHKIARISPYGGDFLWTTFKILQNTVINYHKIEPFEIIALSC